MAKEIRRLTRRETRSCLGATGDLNSGLGPREQVDDQEHAGGDQGVADDERQVPPATANLGRSDQQHQQDQRPSTRASR